MLDEELQGSASNSDEAGLARDSSAGTGLFSRSSAFLRAAAPVILVHPAWTGCRPRGHVQQDHAQQLERAARDEGVVVAGGRPFFTDASGSNFIWLCYSNVADAQLEEGVLRLSRAKRHERLRPTHSRCGSPGARDSNS